MAKQEEVDYTHELSHTDASHPSANALFIPEWYGWVPSARHTPPWPGACYLTQYMLTVL